LNAMGERFPTNMACSSSSMLLFHEKIRVPQYI
jgi:hypothetical protein